MQRCQKFIQDRRILIQIILCLIPIHSLYAGSIIDFKDLAPYKSAKKNSYRGPSNFVPDTELITTPTDEEGPLWINRVVIHDDAGVLEKIQSTLSNWEYADEYAKLWHLETTGLYESPSKKDKQKFLQKEILHYVDKRISGEIKTAKVGSSWHSVGQVHKALKPSTRVNISQDIDLKFKLRVLQGKAFVNVKNPWLNLVGELGFNGHMNLEASKEFQGPKVKTSMKYEVNNNRWIASVEKEIIPTISARLLSEKQGGPNFVEKKANNILSLLFNYPF